MVESTSKVETLAIFNYIFAELQFPHTICGDNKGSPSNELAYMYA